MALPYINILLLSRHESFLKKFIPVLFILDKLVLLIPNHCHVLIIGAIPFDK